MFSSQRSLRDELKYFNFLQLCYFHLCCQETAGNVHCANTLDIFYQRIPCSTSNGTLLSQMDALITSLAKGVMFLAALVCLFVCLFVCEQHYSKSYEQIRMKYYGGVLGSTMKN